MPRYEYLPCTVVSKQHSVRLFDSDNAALVCPPIEEHLAGLTLPEGSLSAALVGYRGKERCASGETERFLDGQPSKVRRLALFLIPSAPSSLAALAIAPDAPVRIMPHRFAKRDDLLRCAREITTREGVEIRKSADSSSAHASFVAHPDSLAVVGDRFRLTLQPERSRGILSLVTAELTMGFVIHQFNRNRLERGTRFVADPVPPESAALISDGVTGGIASIERHENALRVTLAEPLTGVYVLRPILLNGRGRFLFYQVRPGKGACDVA